MRHGVLRRRSKRRPVKKVRFGKRTMKWGGAGSPSAGGGGGGGGGNETAVEVNNVPGTNLDGFVIPAPIAELAETPPAPPAAPPPAAAAAPEIIVLTDAPTPIGYRIWNVIFHSTILYIEAMSAQGVKIRVKQLCAFVWNMLGMISYNGNPLTYYISQSTTYFVVQLVAGANFAQEIFTDFIGGGIAYLQNRALQAGGIALGILQPILAPVGVLINLTGRAAVNVAPLAPPVALIAWMGTTGSALDDVNWLTSTVSNNAMAADQATRRIVAANYAEAIVAMSNPGAFVPTADQMNAYAQRVRGGEQALYLVRRAIAFQTNIVASVSQLSSASAPTATQSAVTVFVYTRGGAINTYRVLSPILEKMWGMSSSAIAQTISGLRGFAIRMYQSGTIVAQTIGWALDNVREVFIHSYRQIARGGSQSDSSRSSVASSLSQISNDARRRIANSAAAGGGTGTSAKSAEAANAIISGIEDAVVEAESRVNDRNAEAMGYSAAEGEEIIGALRAAAMLATPGTANGKIGERIVQTAAGGGNTLEVSGGVIQKQLQNMENIKVDKGKKRTIAEVETVLVPEGSQLLDGETEEESLSPPTAHQERFFSQEEPRGGEEKRRKLEDGEVDEEEEEENVMLRGLSENGGAMEEQGDGEQGDGEQGDGEEAAEEEVEEDMGGNGGRRTRRRRRNTAKAKRGKRKTIKKRKQRRVNKKR